jgi:ActR/RegA family two-component response regulator
LKKILIIDDEEKIRTLLSRIIGLEGFDVQQAGDCKTGLNKLEREDFDVVLCDVKLPDGNGVDLSKKIKDKFPLIEIILLTAYGNIPDGVQAIKNGAFDYITKGDDNNKIIPLLHRAIEKVDLAKLVQKLEQSLKERHSFDKIIVEASFDKRQNLYNEFYQNLYKLPFPKMDKVGHFKHEVSAKSQLVTLFKKELLGKSIIDIGCGSGCFLYALCASELPHKKLYGVDAKKPEIVKDYVSESIEFDEINVVKFTTNERFDLAISDNVFEHIAPADKHFYLGSIRSTLQDDGTLILIIPHKNFGPSDYTMIKDDSRSGAIMAQCAHLNETTYTQVIEDLAQHRI